jgi:hypothetical protein
MDVNKMAGLCLIVLGVVNALHEVVIRYRDHGTPGFAFAFATALLITLGAVLIIRKPIPYGVKAKRPSTGRN